MKTAPAPSPTDSGRIHMPPGAKEMQGIPTLCVPTPPRVSSSPGHHSRSPLTPPGRHSTPVCLPPGEMETGGEGATGSPPHGPALLRAGPLLATTPGHHRAPPSTGDAVHAASPMAARTTGAARMSRAAQTKVAQTRGVARTSAPVRSTRNETTRHATHINSGHQERLRPWGMAGCMTCK